MIHYFGLVSKKWHTHSNMKLTKIYHTLTSLHLYLLPPETYSTATNNSKAIVKAVNTDVLTHGGENIGRVV